MVRVALQPEAQAELNSLADHPEGRTDLRLQQLMPAVFYDTNAGTFLVLPRSFPAQQRAVRLIGAPPFFVFRSGYASLSRASQAWYSRSISSFFC